MIKIWDEHLLDEMNITLAFRYLWRGGNITVRVAALTAFRVFSDGKLIGYGPRPAGPSENTKKKRAPAET